jgi:hypothetical protein
MCKPGECAEIVLEGSLKPWQHGWCRWTASSSSCRLQRICGKGGRGYVCSCTLIDFRGTLRDWRQVPFVCVQSQSTCTLTALKKTTVHINERVSWNDQSGEARPSCRRKLLFPGKAWLWPPPWMQLRCARLGSTESEHCELCTVFPNVRKLLSLIVKQANAFR